MSYEDLMNDSYYMSYKLIEEQHEAFINNLPLDADIVVSHHLPCKDAFASQKAAESKYADFYHANLPDEIVSIPDFWIAGHQHERVEKSLVGQTRFICNPKGSGSVIAGQLIPTPYIA